MEEIGALMQGFSVILTPTNIGLMFVGIILGVLIGVLPGLGGANGVAILLPLTFTMSPTSAIIMLSCIYWGALFGGAIGKVCISALVRRYRLSALIILLLGGQFLITTATSRWEWARVLLLSPSSTLYENGRFREAELRKQRVSQREILSAVRENGLDCLEDVDIITFEPDAEIAVVRKQQTNDSTNADAGEPT